MSRLRHGFTALVIFPNGVVTDAQITGLADLQRAVGGYIEPCRLRYTAGGMYVNEDGRRHNLPPNLVASRLAGVPQGTVLRGNAVVFGPATPAGDETDVTPEIRIAVDTAGGEKFTTSYYRVDLDTRDVPPIVQMGSVVVVTSTVKTSIFGQTLPPDPFEPPYWDPADWIFGRWYSPLCVEGELGTQPLAQCVPIAAGEFAEAEAAGWGVVEYGS